VTSLPSGVEDDPTRRFGAALPETIRRRVLPTQKLVADIAAAVRKGWAVEQLAAEASRDIRPNDPNPGALVTFRVQRAAEIGPPAPSGPARFSQPIPPCGSCDGSPGRWMETLDGDRVIHCPNCWTRPTGGA
jgi:hypothetical protein